MSKYIENILKASKKKKKPQIILREGNEIESSLPHSKKRGSKRNVSHWKKHIGLNAYIRKGEKKQWSVFPILELKNKLNLKSVE